MTEGIDFYRDKSGSLVFTKKYHLNRGNCCGCGCRHCPYEFEAVPEPRKSELWSFLCLHKNGRNDGQDAE
jgi:hypothetical protein